MTAVWSAGVGTRLSGVQRRGVRRRRVHECNGWCWGFTREGGAEPFASPRAAQGKAPHSKGR